MMIFALLIVLAVVPAAMSIAGWWAGPKHDTFIGVAVGANGQEIYATGYNAETKGFLLYQDERKNQKWFNISGIPMDAAITRDKTKIAVTGANGLYTGIPGVNFSPVSAFPSGSHVISQHVGALGQSGFAAVGRFNGVNGVAYTTNGGATWSTSDLGLSVASGYYARYGSFPTDSTWYVTSGTWPFQTDAKLGNGVVARISGRMSVYFDIDANNNPQTTFISARNLLGTYPGAISKTTDGGATWTTVFNSNGKFYLNQIDCIDANNCFAVGEDAKSAVVIKTTNGGATWTQVLKVTGPKSIHAVQMASTSEVYIAGGTPSSGPYKDKDIVGVWQKTTDGGATWTETTFNGYGYDLDLNQGTLLGVAMLKKESEIVIYSESVTKTAPPS